MLHNPTPIKSEKSFLIKPTIRFLVMPNQCIRGVFVLCISVLMACCLAWITTWSCEFTWQHQFKKKKQVVRDLFTENSKWYQESMRASWNSSTTCSHLILPSQLCSGKRKQNMVFIYQEFHSVSKLGGCAREVGYDTKPQPWGSPIWTRGQSRFTL